MNIQVFLAVQISILPLQAILWYGMYTERQRMHQMLRFAVLKLQHTRR